MLSVLPRECLLSGRGQGYNASSAEIKLWNGSKIMGFSAEEPDRLRGPQFHRAWCDELAAWKYPECFDQLMFGLRLGEKPQCVITTTPKPTSLIKNLLKRPDTHVHRGSTFDNEANLAPSALAALQERYGGTTLGRQELYAEVLEDIEGALWSHEMIERSRKDRFDVNKLTRIIVSIDPAVTNTETSDETGIIVTGVDDDNHFYVLEDKSGKMSPDNWGKTAIDCYHRYNADRIVAETNNGGDLVERLLLNIDSSIAYTPVTASRGKLVRAEPISALYEQNRVHHVGYFGELEDQMCSYVPKSKNSPDRLDALVWGLTELSLTSGSAYWRIS